MGSEHTRSSPWVHRSNPAFPHAMVLTVSFVISPVIGLVCHRRLASAQSLTPASRRQDHTTSPSASAPFVKGAARVHRIPSRVRDDREPPLCGTGPNRCIPVSTKSSTKTSENPKSVLVPSDPPDRSGELGSREAHSSRAGSAQRHHDRDVERIGTACGGARHRPRKAGDPVNTGASDSFEKARRTGCPSFAGHDTEGSAAAGCVPTRSWRRAPVRVRCEQPRS